MSAKLPWRGLGISSNLGTDDLPDVFRLRDTAPDAFDFVEYSAPLSLDEARREAGRFDELLARRDELPVVYHPVHLNLYGPEFESDERLAQLREHLREVGSPWVGNDVGWWHHRNVPFPGYLYIPPPFTEDGVRDAAEHALRIQEAIDVPLLLENPAIQARNGELHVLDFMARLHARTGLGLILDLGHLLSHQLSLGLAADDGLDGFPLDQVLEIHIAGGVVTRRGERRFYVDDHTQPVREELFELLEQVLPRCTRLRALTFEGDGHPDDLALRTLRRLRTILQRFTPSECEAPTATAKPERAPLRTRPWELFDQVYAEKGAIEDPFGMRAEADFRLAVLAEKIDRHFPLTRLLLAGKREQLAGFAGSDEFRSLFEREDRALPQVFAAWARARLRAEPDPAAEAALALETWANALLGRNVEPPQPGRAGLAEDVRLGRFAVDLTELIHARHALERHLQGRAWASGLLEQTGFESLRQTARRAAQGPWNVAVRWGRRGLEVLPLSEGLAAVLQAASRGPTRVELLGAPGLSQAALEEAFARGFIRFGPEAREIPSA